MTSHCPLNGRSAPSNFFVVLSQWQSSREEANGSTIRTILFPATSQGNDPTCCIGPANGIEVVVRDAGGITALQVELDESNHTGCGASHNAPQLTSGAYEHAVIDGGKQYGYSNGMGGVRHSALFGDVYAAEFATVLGVGNAACQGAPRSDLI